ncbi:MAG: SDR family NAD(P)-dependent oxidoreductase, partial [Myxococcales bacterium]|nr:SDR family NAD(P)-dependent oxidoreductase [Myxococcales bacterium]
MIAKTALVTGANRGLGLAFCKELAKRNYTIFALCRRASNELNAKNIHVHEGLDLNSAEQIKKIPTLFRSTNLDLVINNAAIGFDDCFDSIDTHGLLQQYNVNAVAPLLLSQALVPLMNLKSKIALISSRMGSISKNDIGKSYAYRMSKAALNMLGKNLSLDLKNKGIAVGV